MASTNKTANLALNQWVLSDPLMMEDVNEDNRKIDAAVGALPYVKLMDITTTADAQQVDLDVSGIDFTKFSMMQIFTDAQADPVGTASYFYVRVNNTGGYWSETTNNRSATRKDYLLSCAANTQLNRGGGMKIEFYNLFNPAASTAQRIYAHLMGAYYYTGEAINECYGTRLANASEIITSINFLTDKSTANIIKGSRFVMYGVKA